MRAFRLLRRSWEPVSPILIRLLPYIIDLTDYLLSDTFYVLVSDILPLSFSLKLCFIDFTELFPLMFDVSSRTGYIDGELTISIESFSFYCFQQPINLQSEIIKQLPCLHNWISVLYCTYHNRYLFLCTVLFTIYDYRIPRLPFYSYWVDQCFFLSFLR